MFLKIPLFLYYDLHVVLEDYLQKTKKEYKTKLKKQAIHDIFINRTQ